MSKNTDSYEYDAYGNHWTVDGSTPNNMLYRGEEYDPDLGLVYLRARYMNPLTGRFLSRDPDDGDITSPEALHKYLYVGGDPVNWIDPSGRTTATMNGGGVEYAEALTISIQATTAITAYTAAVVCELNQDAELLQGLSTDMTAPIESITFGLCTATVKRDNDCEREWKNAHDYCSYLNSIPRKSPEWKKYKNIWGGSYDRCVRGQVSQRCGGNRVD